MRKQKDLHSSHSLLVGADCFLLICWDIPYDKWGTYRDDALLIRIGIFFSYAAKQSMCLMDRWESGGVDSFVQHQKLAH